MNNKEFVNIKSDNRGLSLVELIVAISIGVIVSGTIAALMIFAIRMYRNESVNTSMQYELQTSLNMMMDEIMGAQDLVVEQNSGAVITDIADEASDKPYTRYALFGKFAYDSADHNKIKGFKGVIFVSSAPDAEGKFKIYMNRINATLAAAVTPTAYAASCYNTVTTDVNPDQYLLAENVIQFVIAPDPVIPPATDGLRIKRTEAEKTYTNPIPVKVEIRFERTGWGDKKYEKHVDDTTYLRNKVVEKIYLKEPGDSGFVSYELLKKD